MNPSEALVQAVAATKEHKLKGFEDLFLLTYRDTYADIFATVKDEKTIWNIIKEVYISLWERTNSMPEANLIRPWIRILIKSEATMFENIAISNFPDIDSMDMPSRIGLEEKAQTILLEIEKELHIADFTRHTRAERLGSRSVAITMLKIITAGAIVVFAAVIFAVVFRFVRFVSQSSDTTNVVANVAGDDAIVSRAEGISYGWQIVDAGARFENEDGSYAFAQWLEHEGHLYYFDINGLAVRGIVEIDGQTCYFDDDYSLIGINRTYSIETTDNVLFRNLSSLGRSSQVSRVVADSILQYGDWIYYLLMPATGTSETEETSTSPIESRTDEIYPALMRLEVVTGEMETVSSDVQGYVFNEGKLWYCYDGRILVFEDSSSGEPYLDSDVEVEHIDDTSSPISYGNAINVVEKDGRYQFLDRSGNLVQGTNGYQIIDGREYRIDSGYIRYVTAGEQKINGRTFTLSVSGVDNKIYFSDGSVYLENGIAINSFCIAGDYIYYSAVQSLSTQGSPTSRIYRVEVSTGKQQAVTSAFAGIMQNMYYYSDTSEIYMEYATDGYTNCYGRIAVLTQSHELYVLDDESARAGGYTSGNDRLELIIVIDGIAYCYWHDCTFDASTSAINVVATQTLALSTYSRKPIGQ